MISAEESEPVLSASTVDPLRKIGSTNYAEFETLEKRILAEESEQARKDHATSASQWCGLDHIHGSECKRMIHGCNHDHSDERKIYEKSYADKMIAIRMFREEGNKHFMAKELSSAAVSYRRSLLYLDYTLAEKEKDDDEIDRERFKCHLNLAATKLDQMDFSEAIAQCRLALQIDSTSSKAHYRKGFAHLKRSEYYEAQEHLYKAMKLAASDTHENRRPIEDAIRDLNIKIRDYKKRSAEIAKSALK